VPIGKKFIQVKANPNEALRLFVQAFDFKVKEDPVIAPKVRKEFTGSETAIPEQYFPPCIQKISAGMQDGKKRALFALINFLTSAGWQYEDIEEYCKKWNTKNPEPLREVYLLGQLRYAKTHKKVILPPNCANHSYWQDLQVCAPDGFCKRIKNPANYAIFKQKIAAQNAPKPKKKKQTKEKVDEKPADSPKTPESDPK
jgi:DNA primase large subunit